MRALVAAVAVAAAGVLAAPTAASAAPAPVSLVVGLRTPDAAGVVAGLSDTVDVLDSERLTGAVTVDVPAGQTAAAAAALRADPAVAYVEPERTATIDATTPNDPEYSRQWGITRTRVNQAWDTTRGSSAVIIAVVDTGVSRLPDLAPRMLPGYDFVNNDADPTDDNGHGTGSAEVLGASGYNGIGVAGVCWSCRILPVKVLGATGSGSYTDIAEGIRYAADRGADIINLSLGGSSDSQLLRDAVAYAVGKGSLVLAAAGNSASPAMHYPAAIPSVIAVGGSTNGDARYPWSNYGANWVDLAAPGCNLAQVNTGALTDFCGTSSATPFAAGVAALLASTTPQPSAAVIRKALMDSATPLAGNWVDPGSGRIDAAAALAALPFRVAGVVNGGVVGNAVTVRSYVGSGSGITRVTATLNGDVVATTTAAPWTMPVDTRGASGPSSLTVNAYAGSRVANSVTVTVVGDHTAPAAAFASPVASSILRGIATVSAAAGDNVGVAKVELAAGGRIVATDTAAPYALRFSTAGLAGPTVLTLRVTDRAGNSTVARRTVYVDNVAPAVAITGGPANGTRRIRSTQYVTAKAADAYGVNRIELLVNGRVISRSAGTLRQFAVPTGAFGSTLRVQVRAYDRAGNASVTPVRTWYR